MCDLHESRGVNPVCEFARYRVIECGFLAKLDELFDGPQVTYTADTAIL
jgi:hypothetical protein